jgi:DNA-binding CsgD family transcriptional regulator
MTALQGPDTEVVLSPRELELLQHMSYGRSYPQLAATTNLASDTWKAYGRRLFTKLGCTDRAHAVRIGFELGLLTGYQPGLPPLRLQRGRVQGVSDRHIAACFAAEACPCRREVNGGG